MNEDLKERLRFYQELGIEELYRRERLPDAHVAPPATGPGNRSLSSAGTSGAAAAEAGAVPPRHAGPKVISTREMLEAIRAEIGPDCRRCKLCGFGRHTIVFGSGNVNAEVVFVGEGPGADEDEQGLPFVGRAGQLLTEMINKSAERMKVPLRREQVYICNVVKCRPPGNRTPEKDEMETCSPFLLRQLDAIRPRAIVTLGATAAHLLLGRSDPMNRLRGHWFDCRGAKLLVTFHPAYLLRDPSKKREAWEDMQMLYRFLYNLS